MKTTFCILFATFTIASSPLHAQSRSRLDDEIVRLKEQIAAERVAVDQLSQPFLVPSQLHFALAAAPVVDLIKGLNTLPEPERTINFAVNDHNGQLWGWDAGCTFGDEGEYVEFADPNYRVEAGARLSNFDASWIPGQGLRLTVKGDGRLGIGTIHWHKDPCVGGGAGGHAGPATCNGTGRLNAVAGLTLGADRVLRYRAALNLNAISYGCAINCGSLGDIQFGNLVPSPPATTFEGGLPLPLKVTGLLESSDPRLPLRKEYEVQLVAPAAAMTATGVNVATNVSVVWR